MNRQEAKKRVMKDFLEPPPQKTLDWFVDGYLRIHDKPKENVAMANPQQLKLF